MTAERCKTDAELRRKLVEGRDHASRIVEEASAVLARLNLLVSALEERIEADKTIQDDEDKLYWEDRAT